MPSADCKTYRHFSWAPIFISINRWSLIYIKSVINRKKNIANQSLNKMFMQYLYFSLCVFLYLICRFKVSHWAVKISLNSISFKNNNFKKSCHSFKKNSSLTVEWVLQPMHNVCYRNDIFSLTRRCIKLKKACFLAIF